jgi:hypothetical protein
MANMDMIPLKPERKAQLEEYAKRRGQNLLRLSTKRWPLISSGSARTSQKRSRASVAATKI